MGLGLLPFLSGAFAALTGMFATWVSKKIALVAAVLALSAGLWVAFAATLVTIASGINYVLPDWMVGGVGLFLPSNAVPCLSALMAARMARAAYEYQKENLRLASYVT